MVVRITRGLFFAWFLALAALLIRGAAHGWTASVLAGLYLLVLAHPTLLGLEFILSRFVSRKSGATHVGAAAVWRAWRGEWVASTVLFGWRLPWRADAIADHLPGKAQGVRGVVFVHGILCNRAIWNPWLASLRLQERAFVAVNLEPVFARIDDYVPLVDAAVRRVEAVTGLAPVIVAHSMGGLVARAWLRSHVSPAAHVITIGTPHRGTWLARWSTSPAARQMRAGSPWLTALEADEADDKGERGRLFTCWWSDCDQIVYPSPAPVLAGSKTRCLTGVGHVALTKCDEIAQELQRRLAQ